MNLYQDVAAKIAASGFSMTTVCERAGVSSGTPTHWAAGRTSPTQSTYDKIMTALRELCEERQARIKAAGI